MLTSTWEILTLARSVFLSVSHAERLLSMPRREVAQTSLFRRLCSSRNVAFPAQKWEDAWHFCSGNCSFGSMWAIAWILKWINPFTSADGLIVLHRLHTHMHINTQTKKKVGKDYCQRLLLHLRWSELVRREIASNRMRWAHQVSSLLQGFSLAPVLQQGGTCCRIQ